MFCGYLEYRLYLWRNGKFFVNQLKGSPLFVGDSEIDQLFKIFIILGTPNKNVWPEVENTSYYNIKWPKWNKKPFESVIPDIPPFASSVLNVISYNYRKCLCMNHMRESLQEMRLNFSQIPNL